MRSPLHSGQAERTHAYSAIWPRQTSLELMQAKIVPSLAGMLIIAKNA
jgi:hypothetical protein